MIWRYENDADGPHAQPYMDCEIMKGLRTAKGGMLAVSDVQPASLGKHFGRGFISFDAEDVTDNIVTQILFAAK